MVLALGSTKARTRLYRIGITNNLTEIEEDFEVFGFAQGDGMKFQKQIELNPLFDTCLNCTSLLIKHL